MFGLEKQKKKKKAEPFIFEIENELKNAKRHQELKKEIENKIQKLKESLRDGENKEDYEGYGALLYGYTSLLKVFSRCPLK